jgi:hypothetical protein
MRPSAGRRSALSALTSALPVLVVVAFIVWTLWRRRSAHDSVDVEAVLPIVGPTPMGEPELSTIESDALGPTGPAAASPTPVRWEPPVRSADPLPNRPEKAHTEESPPGEDARPGSRPRGRIEDLLERARLDDEGAA